MGTNIPWSVNNVSERLTKTLDRVSKNDKDVKAVFTSTFAPGNVKTKQPVKSPLAGALVSVKDLFDVEGHVTRAGTKFMENDAAALCDAPPISQLRKAGAVMVGHTNMTELAFSGLGINPHYGTPANTLIPGTVPGGSTAGGAVSVATGLADIAVGTDTGGSLRIPAAFNGIVGFKPSQISVSRQGCKTLSSSLDSVGPMAGNVRAVRLAYHAMRQSVQAFKTFKQASFVVPTNFGMDDLDSAVSDGFKAALDKLSNAGFAVEERSIPVLDTLKTLPLWHFASVESMAEYQQAMDKHIDIMDPRVASRIARAKDVDAVSYCQSLSARRTLISQYQADEADNIILMPTCPVLPPKLADLLDDDDRYYATNLQVLRNPSVANVLDACSVSLPYKHQSHTIGVMLTAANLHDDALLNVAQRCESIFR